MKAKQLQKMLDFLEEMYTANRYSSNPVNYRILQQFSRWFLVITKFVLIMFGCAFGFIIISPLPIYLLTGKLELILPLHIPFVDTETTSGYAAHTTYLFVVLSSAYFGLAGSEMLTMVVTIHISPIVSIFDQSVRALNEATTGRRQEAIKNSTWLRENFRNIVLMQIKIYS